MLTGEGLPTTNTTPAAPAAPVANANSSIPTTAETRQPTVVPIQNTVPVGDPANIPTAGSPRTNVKPREVPLDAGVDVEKVMAALLQIQKANAAQQDDASVAGSAGEEGNIPMYDTEPDDVVIPPGASIRMML